MAIPIGRGRPAVTPSEAAASPQPVPAEPRGATGGAEAGGAVFHKTFRSLTTPAYRLLWLGMVTTWLAMTAAQVARGYLAYEMTGSALALGEVTLAMALPRLFLSPLGGALADRYSKSTLLLWSQVLAAVIAGATALLVYAHLMTIDWLLVLGLFQGTGFAANMPVRQALVPELVGRAEDLGNALAINNAGMNLTRLVGPAVAGILISVPGVGVAGTFLLCVVILGFACLTSVLLPRVDPVPGRAEPLGGAMASGFRYLFRNPSLMVLMSLGFVPLVLGMPYLQLMPVFALGVLHVGATGLGLLLTTVGVGGLCGTLATAYLSDRPNRAATQLTIGVLFGAGLAAFAGSSLVHFLPGAVAGLLLCGASGDAYMALNATLLMMNTDRAMYGRVMGTYMTLQSARQVSVLPMGAIADAVGAPLTLGVAGLITCAFVGGVRAWYPRYREIG